MIIISMIVTIIISFGEMHFEFFSLPLASMLLEPISRNTRAIKENAKRSKMSVKKKGRLCLVRSVIY